MRFPFLRDATLVDFLRLLPQRGYVVGGAVRDALMGRDIQDVDVAVGVPIAEIITCLRPHYKIVESGLHHGTITAILRPSKQWQALLDAAGLTENDARRKYAAVWLKEDFYVRAVEVTQFREDLTTDGRHATVGYTPDLRTDAKRRDFAINAMYVDCEGNLTDLFGGQSDLVAKIVRFVGDPQQRLVEDHLRQLRYYRFRAQLGFSGPETPRDRSMLQHALEVSRPHLAQLSAERRRDELNKLLAAPPPSATAVLLDMKDDLPAILPSTEPMPNLVFVRLRWQLACDVTPPTSPHLTGRDGLANSLAEWMHDLKHPMPKLVPLLRLAALVPCNAGKTVARGLKLPKSQTAALVKRDALMPWLRGVANLKLSLDTDPEELYNVYQHLNQHAGAPLLLAMLTIIAEILEENTAQSPAPDKWHELLNNNPQLAVLQDICALRTRTKRRRFPLTGTDALSEGCVGVQVREFLKKTTIIWLKSKCRMERKKILLTWKKNTVTVI